MYLTVVLITIVVFALAICGLAIGVIISNRRLKGSCGGLANLTDSSGKTLCDACTNPSPECQGEPIEEAEVTQS